MANNKSSYFKDWTKGKLTTEYKSIYELIYTIGCYGVSDLMLLDGLENEILRRGYTIQTSPEIY